MLDRTAAKLRSYYDSEPQIGDDGQLHPIDSITRTPPEQIERMAKLHLDIKPDLSIETGLAYGFFALSILDAMTEHGYGHHIAIDPGQGDYWRGIGCAAIRELGFSDRFTWIDDRSDRAFVKLIEKKERAQYICFDGLHTFEAVIADVFLADQLLDVGGVLIVSDMWMPSIRAVASFLGANFTHYETLPSIHENIFVIRKTKNDDRPWDHFASFDGSGSEIGKKKGVLSKLLGG